MNPVKVLGDGSCFIVLQVPDEMPGKVQVTGLADLVESLLDEILAEIPLAQAGGGDNFRKRLLLAHSEQFDSARLASGLSGRRRQQISDQL